MIAYNNWQGGVGACGTHGVVGGCRGQMWAVQGRTERQVVGEMLV